MTTTNAAPFNKNAKKDISKVGKNTITKPPSPKKKKEGGEQVNFIYLFAFRLRGTHQLIWFQLRDNPNQDGYSHPLYDLVHTDGSWARVEERILASGSRRALPGPGVSPVQQNDRDSYPRCFYIRDEEVNLEECLNCIASVSLPCVAFCIYYHSPFLI